MKLWMWHFWPNLIISLFAYVLVWALPALIAGTSWYSGVPLIITVILAVILTFFDVWRHKRWAE